jgi:hypothetical protein
MAASKLYLLSFFDLFLLITGCFGVGVSESPVMNWNTTFKRADTNKKLPLLNLLGLKFLPEYHRSGMSC